VGKAGAFQSGAPYGHKTRVEVENTPAYYNTATNTAIKSFKVDAAGWRVRQVWREKSNFNSFSRLIYKIHCAPKKVYWTIQLFLHSTGQSHEKIYGRELQS
jgi:hypothetical protein